MTQLERYAQMMKVNLGQVHARIGYSVSSQGSVLAQTVQAKADKIVIHYDLESPDAPERVAGLLRNARNGCYARQSIARPDLFEDTVNLNGQPFNLADYPPPARG